MRGNFLELVKRIRYYNDALAVMFWDLRTGAPKKGVTQRSEVIGMMSEEIYKLSTSEEMEKYLLYFEAPARSGELGDMLKTIVKECRREFDRYRKIPSNRYKEYVILISNAEAVWEDAKNSNDFQMFRPYLEKIVRFNQEFIGLWGYQGNKYNTLLDINEPGMTVEKLDAIFNQLRTRIVPLAAKINASKRAQEPDILSQHYDIKKQEEFSLYVLKEMGYDFEAGRLDESEHPFTIGINPGDVRITTHYYPEDLASALMSSMHEGGHALYEQNISSELYGTPLCTGASMGIHESQSRFWENIIGRSKGFWEHYYGELQKIFPEQLSEVSLDSFYKAINRVQPSLIRVEADEVTYNLHVMIRYEIEKALINGEIEVADLPEVWNSKMKEYLGVVPSNDTKGVLQDVHWAGGSFGYFPSYTLGNIYAAQIYNTAKKEIADFDKLIAEGELVKIKQWLTNKVYQYGKLMEPEELIVRITGEAIDPRYLTDYLENKYKNIYEF